MNTKYSRNPTPPGQLFLLMLRLEGQLGIRAPFVASQVHCILQQSPPLIVLKTLILIFQRGGRMQKLLQKVYIMG